MHHAERRIGWDLDCQVGEVALYESHIRAGNTLSHEIERCVCEHDIEARVVTNEILLQEAIECIEQIDRLSLSFCNPREDARGVPCVYAEFRYVTGKAFFRDLVADKRESKEPY